MLYLMTGTPGASKTLNTIKFVNEEPTFQNRPVYYYNIVDLSPQFGWTQLKTLDEAREWFKLPPGSVIVFDEAYDVFPQRGPTQSVPEHIKQLATHRHHGYDVVLICQKVKGQLDSFIRGLVNHHWHYERKFGANITTRFQWERCIEDVNGYHERKAATAKLIKFDKKYFGAYKSAEVHTVKRRLPVGKLGIFVFALLAGGFAAYSAINIASGFTDNANDAFGVTAATDPVADAFHDAGIRTAPVTMDDWYEMRQARVPGFPHTAPVYDVVTEPVTFPRPNCVLWKYREPQECQCYTQQATRMDVPTEICMQIVKNGWFDHTRPDTQDEKDSLADRRQNRDLESRPARPHGRGYVNPDSYLIGSGDHLILTSK